MATLERSGTTWPTSSVSLPQRPARRFWIRVGMALCASSVVSARADTFVSEAALYVQLTANFIRPALNAMVIRQWPVAITLLEQARDIVEANAVVNWPFRRYVYVLYGVALLETSCAEDAVIVLQLAAEAEHRILAENLPRFSDIVRSMDTGLGKALLKSEYIRQVLAGVTMADQQLKSIDAGLGDVTIGSADVVTTLGRALLITGRHVQLLALCQETLDAMVPPKSIEQIASQEYRCIKLAGLLKSINLPDQASGALARALDLNVRRCELAQQLGNSLSSTYAAYSVRRSIVSERLLLSHQGNSWQENASSWCEAIMDAKGGGMRYAAQVRARLNGASDPRVRAYRDSAYQLEDEMSALPTTSEGARAFLVLSAQREAYLLAGLQLLPPIVFTRQVNWIALMQARLDDDAFIGFFRYQGASSIADIDPPPARYIRYCVTRTEIQLQDLGEAREIERIISTFRSAILRKSQTLDSGKQVFSALLATLPGSVHSATGWRIDPDGILALLPFEALPDENGQLLLMNHTIRTASLAGTIDSQTSAKQQVTEEKIGRGALILANPKYAPRGQSSNNIASYASSTRGTFERQWSADAHAAPLPDTAIEAKHVATSLASIGIASTILQEADASRVNLEHAVSPQILHIAAHAVMVDSAVGQANKEIPRFGHQSETIIDLIIPGRRSGLVLSLNGNPDLVLAKDIARLALSSTVLVVLSACNTGNGDVVAGEGLSSLRSALEEAGALSTVTSVWAVPSAATVDLMKQFYTALGQGATTTVALSRAKKHLHARGRPPFEWAGFLLSGADGRLVAG
jgi:CHAT domain-containing protein